MVSGPKTHWLNKHVINNRHLQKNQIVIHTEEFRQIYALLISDIIYLILFPHNHLPTCDLAHSPLGVHELGSKSILWGAYYFAGLHESVCMCDVWYVCVFPSACPCTYPLTCLHLYEWAFIFAGPFQTFQNLAYSGTTYLYKMGLLCLHVSLFKQCLTDRVSSEKQGVSMYVIYISWVLKSHGYNCARIVLYHNYCWSSYKMKIKRIWMWAIAAYALSNDSGSWSNLFCAKRSQEERGFFSFSQKIMLQNLEWVASQPYCTKCLILLHSTLWQYSGDWE